MKHGKKRIIVHTVDLTHAASTKRPLAFTLLIILSVDAHPDHRQSQ